jgi:hypothetical protein
VRVLHTSCKRFQTASQRFLKPRLGHSRPRSGKYQKRRFRRLMQLF